MRTKGNYRFFFFFVPSFCRQILKKASPEVVPPTVRKCYVEFERLSDFSAQYRKYSHDYGKCQSKSV